MISKENTFTALFLIVCLLVVFLRLSSNPSEALRDEALTLSESKQMHTAFGGEEGEAPVTIFVASWCSVCSGLEETLRAKSIPYITVDVEKNREAAMFFQRFSQGRRAGVPLTVVGPYVVFGYDPNSIVSLHASLLEQGGEMNGNPDVAERVTAT